jgi:uncharacterized protein (TIGR00369 family)
MTPRGHSPDCFVCGLLGVELRVADGRVLADLLLDQRFTGPPGVVHGGAISAVFDELLGAAVHEHTTVARTAHLEVDYRRPFPIGEPARMTGQAEWLGERKLVATGELVGQDGRVLAEARGLWIVPRATA